MDIKEFRIVEDALSGFYIQRLFKYDEEKYSFIGAIFGFSKKIHHEEWKRISEGGHISKYYSGLRYYRAPLTSFKTKQEAIDYLEKLCTPNNFYYPTSFQEASND